MNKCPKCGYEATTADEYSQSSSFKSFMKKKLHESAKRMKEEMGYGIPVKKKDAIKFNKPKVFKGELDHVERKG